MEKVGSSDGEESSQADSAPPPLSGLLKQCYKPSSTHNLLSYKIVKSRLKLETQNLYQDSSVDAEVPYLILLSVYAATFTRLSGPSFRRWEAFGL